MLLSYSSLGNVFPRLLSQLESRHAAELADRDRELADANEAAKQRHARLLAQQVRYTSGQSHVPVGTRVCSDQCELKQQTPAWFIQPP